MIDASRKDPIRVLCVDDNPGVLNAIAVRLNQERDLQCVGTLPSADHLVETAAALRPDIAILDVEMPGRNIFQAVEELQQVQPQIRVIMLSAHLRTDFVDQATSAGAWGYVSKADSGDEIIDAVRRVASGEFVLGSLVAELYRRHGW